MFRVASEEVALDSNIDVLKQSTPRFGQGTYVLR
jgi:hypothetical protein